MMIPRAIIFDFDGVLMDTEWAIFNSWVTLYKREGCALTLREYAACLGAGYSRWDPAAHLQALTGKTYDWEAENTVRQAAIERDLSTQSLMPGTEPLLTWCRQRGIRMVVASSSSRRWVLGWLTHLNASHFFERLFCRTDGYAVKPDPALFLAARDYLGVASGDCLIVEDSENGVLAARHAGIPCLAIPNRMTAHGDFSAASAQLPSLAALLDRLRAGN